MSDYISRSAAINEQKRFCGYLDNDILNRLEIAIGRIPAADVRPVPEGGIGEMSDGYHTFNGLYYQRMILFAALVKTYRSKAWKSWKHEDGELCFGGGWFIVGIDTPQGSYTYHYEAKDFNLFDCEELPVAKHWDGHTEEDVTRLLSLDVRPVVRARWVAEKEDVDWGCSTVRYRCSHCGRLPHFDKESFKFLLSDFCPKCGAKMNDSKQESKQVSIC